MLNTRGATGGGASPPAFHTFAKDTSLNRGATHFTLELGHVLSHPSYYKSGIFFWPFLSENFLSKLKNREEFEGGLEKKRKGKEEKKKRVIKHTLKYLYEA